MSAMYKEDATMTVSRATPNLKRIKQQTQLVQKGKLLMSPKIDAWLAAHNGEFVLNQSEADLFGQLLGDHLARIPRVRSGSFSASARGNCKRQQVFGYLGVPGLGSVDSLTAMRFIDGKIKHLTFQYIALQAGALTDIEVPIPTKIHRVLGTMDGWNKPAGYGFELKTTQAFDYYVNKGVPQSHNLQIATYFIGAQFLDKFALVYWDTRSREWKEFVINREQHKPWIKLAWAEITQLNDAVIDRQLPEVLDECKKGTGKTFKECPYSSVCLGCTYDAAEAIGQGGAPPVQSRSVSVRARHPRSAALNHGTRRVRKRPAR
jgi:hypothetical protein